MVIPLKTERNDAVVGAAVPMSLKEKVQGYAGQHGVSESQAIRHILSLFFDGNFSETEENIHISEDDGLEPEVIP